VNVDNQGIERLRARLRTQEATGPLVLMPTHRSYVDFLALSFVLFSFNLPLPQIAAGEDFMNLGNVTQWLRSAGAFFIRRQFAGDPLYQAIARGYMGELLAGGQMVEFFVEGTRSRAGKQLVPKLGLLRNCVEPLLAGRVPDVTLVPIAIDYECPLEVSMYANEMLGKGKIKESLPALLRSATVLARKFGVLTISFAEPVSVRAFAGARARQLGLGLQQGLPPRGAGGEGGARGDAELGLADESGCKQLVEALGWEVTARLQETSVCAPTHLVATLLLLHPHGIRLDDLVDEVVWLREEVLSRGGAVDQAERVEATEMVERAVGLLGAFAVQRPERPGCPVAPALPEGREDQHTLALQYFRNKLLALFGAEALVAVCAQALGADSDADAASAAAGGGAPVREVVREARFLQALLAAEFGFPSPPLDAHRPPAAATLPAAAAAVVAAAAAPAPAPAAAGLGSWAVHTAKAAVGRTVGVSSASAAAAASPAEVSASAHPSAASAGPSSLEARRYWQYRRPDGLVEGAMGALRARGVLEDVVQDEDAGLSAGGGGCGGCDGGRVRVGFAGERLHALLCSFAWPLLDSYWLAATALRALCRPPAVGAAAGGARSRSVLHSSLLSRMQVRALLACRCRPVAEACRGRRALRRTAMRLLCACCVCVRVTEPTACTCACSHVIRPCSFWRRRCAARACSATSRPAPLSRWATPSTHWLP
jgi:1-acyl-sn-glycerol-3-phosphate acyltransferase